MYKIHLAFDCLKSRDVFEITFYVNNIFIKKKVQLQIKNENYDKNLILSGQNKLSNFNI